MNHHLSSLLTSFTRSPRCDRSLARNRRARLCVECLEGRQLMAASVAPKSLLIYYGWPSAINGAANLSQAATTLSQYSYVVLGDTLELSSNGDYGDTKSILANPAMAHTTVFGYVDLGVTTQDLNMTPVAGKQSIEGEILDWKAMGVQGIYLDDFGYDYDTSRTRQNDAVEYAHSLGLVVMANAYTPADAFGNTKCTLNPGQTPTALGPNDFYLYESYQVTNGAYVPASTWEGKAGTVPVNGVLPLTGLAAYQAKIGFRIMAVTTTDTVNNTYNDLSPAEQSQFNYAWYSAFQAGYTAVGWGEYDYDGGASTEVPSISPPTISGATTYTGSVVESGSLFTRDTNLGQIEVNAASYTGSIRAASRRPVLHGQASLSNTDQPLLDRRPRCDRLLGGGIGCGFLGADRESGR